MSTKHASGSRRRIERTFGIVLAVVGVVLLGFAAKSGRAWRDAVPDRVAEVEAKFVREGREFADANDRAGALFRQVKRVYYVRTGLWWAAVGAGGLCLVLAVSRRYWVGEPVMGPSPRRKERSPWFSVVVGSAVLVGAVLRWERIDLSLYNDEAYTFHRHVAGSFSPVQAGEPHFEPVVWADTLWENHLANNSPPFSVLARLSYSAWLRFSGQPPGTVDERAIRAPAFIGGLLGIVLVGILGRSLAGWRGGAFAAILMAIHPWAVRFGSEGRSYGLVLMLSPTALLLLVLALRRGTWGAWLGYMLAAAALMAAFAGSLFLLAVANGSALLSLRMERNPCANACWQWRRLLVANAMAAALYALSILPCLLQMLTALPILNYEGAMDARWLVDQAAQFLIGGTWFPSDPSVDLESTDAAWRSGFWGIVAVLWGAIATALLVRAGRKWRVARSVGGITLLAAAILTVPVAFGFSKLTGTYFFPWYTTPVLPAFIVVLGAGAGDLRKPAMAFGAVLGFALAAVPVLAVYRFTPKEPVKEAVVLARGAVYPSFDPEAAEVVGFYTEAISYDPHLRAIMTVADLEAAVSSARARGRPLYVLFARRPLVEQSSPDLLSAIEDSGRFSLVGHLIGFGDVQYENYVYRWREPGAPEKNGIP